jgi:tRNA pseudouridine38-40 synthase
MRVALGIEYDGSDFLGWQRLGHGAAIQAVLEDALTFVANEPVRVVCAGRTDAGVHARCQVVHFDTRAARRERAWVLGVNARLPRTVVVRWARPVADDFHARFRALARRYRYRILNRAVRPALEARYVAWERVPLAVEAMREAAQALLGEHDFSAFRSVGCQAHHARRRIDAIEIARDGECVSLDIEANAFLHHMVRNIVGSLLPIGRGERPVGWIAELLAGRDRRCAGPTAPAQGLTFLGPRYARQWGLPEEVSVP